MPSSIEAPNPEGGTVETKEVIAEAEQALQNKRTYKVVSATGQTTVTCTSIIEALAAATEMAKGTGWANVYGQTGALLATYSRYHDGVRIT